MLKTILIQKKFCANKRTAALQYTGLPRFVVKICQIQMDQKGCLLTLSEEEGILLSDFPRIDQKFGVKARDRAVAGSHVSSGQNVGTGSDVRSWVEGPGGS